MKTREVQLSSRTSCGSTCFSWACPTQGFFSVRDHTLCSVYFQLVRCTNTAWSRNECKKGRRIIAALPNIPCPTWQWHISSRALAAYVVKKQLTGLCAVALFALL